VKAVIKFAVSYKDIRKHLPPMYNDVIPASLKKSENVVNIVCFPYGTGKVVTSKYVQSAYKKVSDSSLPTVFFGDCFTLEARTLILNNGDSFYFIDGYDWTDETWNNIHNGNW
jgi:hypothetical protein